MAHPIHQSPHSLTTMLYEVKIVLLFKLKYCVRNHSMKYLYTQNLWKFSFNVHNRANSCLLEVIVDQGATHRLLKELNVCCWDWNCLLVIWYQYLIIFLDVCSAVFWVKYYDHYTKENDFGSLCKFGWSVYINLPFLAKRVLSVCITLLKNTYYFSFTAYVDKNLSAFVAITLFFVFYNQ